MQVFVRSVAAEPILVNLPVGATVNDLKAAIEDVEFIPAHMQRIVYASSSLTSGKVAEIVPECATVEMEIAVDGGMRLKWRKKRMRRLRRKRRKMRMRAQ